MSFITEGRDGDSGTSEILCEPADRQSSVRQA